MALEKIADKVVETDVLIVGGGIAGCCAAGEAKITDPSLNVTLLEKGNTQRSGSTAQGIDHYGGFCREGLTPLDWVKSTDEAESSRNGEGKWADPNIVYKWHDSMFWVLEELEKLGVTAKWDDGEYRWSYRGGPGLVETGRIPRVGLRVHWRNIKPNLSAAMKKLGVNIIERTMLVDLLTNNGTVVGATALNTRTGEFVVIKTKTIVLATGWFTREYEPEIPQPWKYKMLYHWCPASASGDGYAVAYRAGAGLYCMDVHGWYFRIRDDVTLSYGNVVTEGVQSKLFDSRGNELSQRMRNSPLLYAELERKGLTPWYYSLENLPEEYHDRLQVNYTDERMLGLKCAETRGFNPKTHWYEVMSNKPLQFGMVTGVWVDDDYKASIKGLCAIGDCASSMEGCPGATTSGCLLGADLPKHASEAGGPAIDEGQVESQKQVAYAPLSVGTRDGTEPMELECAVRNVCERYVGQFKSEGKLNEGLRRIGSLKREFLHKLTAQNPHHLMKCLEVRNIIELAEVHIQACLERRETRGQFIRVDYPERDPSRDSRLAYQRLENGKPVYEIIGVPELKPEYAKGVK
ncbi:MAG: FAD-dependent oxidoreductase [Promethearchaeota archaeon]